MATLKFQSRYRVYPPHASLRQYARIRSRSFRYLHKAIAFAEHCVLQQGLVASERVQIVIGSGSDFKAVGFCDTSGFHNTEEQ